MLRLIAAFSSHNPRYQYANELLANGLSGKGKREKGNWGFVIGILGCHPQGLASSEPPIQRVKGNPGASD
jgi:hypothetical protein